MNSPLQKHDISAALAHELRRPLGAISSAAEVLKQLSVRVELKDPRDAELMASAQAIIARQTEHLARMIDDLLCTARSGARPRLEAGPQARIESEGSGNACRVLVIEDNEDSRDALRLFLELEGHSVATAEDGAQGLNRLLIERPDVAIIDIGLPGLSGFELAKRSRRAGYAGQLLALSGYTSDEDMNHALRNGFDAYLAKPLDPNSLRRLMPGPGR